jgi:hypothetical protein
MGDFLGIEKNNEKNSTGLNIPWQSSYETENVSKNPMDFERSQLRAQKEPDASYRNSTRREQIIKFYNTARRID